MELVFAAGVHFGVEPSPPQKKERCYEEKAALGLGWG